MDQCQRCLRPKSHISSPVGLCGQDLDLGGGTGRRFPQLHKTSVQTHDTAADQRRSTLVKSINHRVGPDSIDSIAQFHVDINVIPLGSAVLDGLDTNKGFIND